MKGLPSDSRFYQALGMAIDLVVLNLAMVVTGLPVVTGGAALVAGLLVCLRMVRGDAVRPIRDFLAAFDAICARVADEMRGLADGALAHGDMRTLNLLAGSRGMAQGEMAARLGLSAVGVSRQMEALERAGLIERRPHQFDRRSKVAALTADGQALVLRMRQRSGELARDLFRDTPDERLAMLGVVSAQAAGRLSNARR